MKTKEMYDGYVVQENGTIIGKRGVPLLPQDNGKGYLIVSVFIGGKRTVKSVHRILAEAFIENPDNLSDVDHEDADRRNNKLSNLRWISHSGNIQHRYNLGMRSAKGENNVRCKTTEQTVHEICRLLSLKVSCSEIRDRGFDYELARKVKRRSTWKDISNLYSW